MGRRNCAWCRFTSGFEDRNSELLSSGGIRVLRQPTPPRRIIILPPRLALVVCRDALDRGADERKRVGERLRDASILRREPSLRVAPLRPARARLDCSAPSHGT